MTRVCALLFALLIPAMAQAMELEPLMQRLAATSHPPRQFTEQRYSELLLAPLELEGSLSFDHGTLIKHIRTPFDERFTIEGDTLQVERSEPASIQQLQLDDFPLLLSFVTVFRATLAGDLATLQRHYHTTLLGDEGRWRLQLRPLSPSLAARLKMVEVAGDETGIHRFTIEEQSGDYSTLQLGEALP